jgi:peptidoglycan/LPS O-acetylase OafA/YrhL
VSCSAKALRDFNYKNNSIGFLRFLLASLVVWSHSPGLGGFGVDPIARFSGGFENGGTLAVAGFFFLSGFLITRSYGTSGSIVAFMWHRFLRIFPGFWVCLAASALVFAPLAFAHQNASLAEFVSRANPLGYIVNNALLQIRQPTMGTLVAQNPYSVSFNAPLWTLFYEFLCYISIAMLGYVGVLRFRPFAVVVISVSLFVVFAAPPLLVKEINSVPPVFRIIEVILYFCLGACAFLYRELIPIRGWIAGLCAIAVALAMPTRAFGIVLPVCLSYVVIYAAMKWPIRSFDRRADLSYGIYIYAFAVGQMLVIFGLNRFGSAPYFVATYAITLALAAMSWFCIERPSLSLKHRLDRGPMAKDTRAIRA